MQALFEREPRQICEKGNEIRTVLPSVLVADIERAKDNRRCAFELPPGNARGRQRCEPWKQIDAVSSSGSLDSGNRLQQQQIATGGHGASVDWLKVPK